MELALRLFLVAQMIDPPILWFQRVPLLIAAGAMLLVPALLRDARAWAGVTLLTAGPLLWNWPFSDNHDYLRAFTALAATLALTAREPAAALRTSARLMLGLVFLFATLWKVVISPDWLDGTFFRVTLLSDPRFHELAVLLGGASWATLDAFDLALTEFLAGQGGWPGAFVEPPGLAPLALALTAYTALIEGGIALAFLWPRAARTRNALLLLFAVTTFSFATVRGFGFLLMTLGAAQCEEDERRARIAYVATLFLIEAYRSVPWSRMLLEQLGLVGP